MAITFVGEVTTFSAQDAAAKLLWQHRGDNSLVYRFAKGTQAGRDGVASDAQMEVQIVKVLHGDPANPHITCRLLWRRGDE